MQLVAAPITSSHILVEGDERTHTERLDSDTHQPLPEGFHPVFGWGLVVGICLDLGDSGVEIHILRQDRSGSLPEPRASVQYREGRNGQITCDKVGRGPVPAEENRPAAELCKTILCQAGNEKKKGDLLDTPTKQMMRQLMAAYHAA
jgi:hypothetical protein